MPTHPSPWFAHAAQRTAAGPAKPLPPPARMEWTTRPGQGPGDEILGTDLHQRQVLELGCGPGHNIAYLAVRRGAHVTGVDLVGLQIRRARSHYGHISGATFVAGHALHFLQASQQQYEAIYSVFGAIGLVMPNLLLPAIAAHLKPGRTLAFSVPHPARRGRRPAADDHPRRDFVTLPDYTRLPLDRWEFDAARWADHLADAGLALNHTQEFDDPRLGHWPTTLLIAARKQ
ncbi:class I SAM-dependent methyltransferase [Streptomyces sp. CMB-StM0423]|uniref:class I SAM-dependent methyltransferase n=1 Tax=Streptomyces sp. CMB-StM0423 TaxID=2059884 RepID=UPI000C701BA6|nr:class I SAM-dependent methyltransferase [Streptomyces sp. CMB-StM0423]AUH41652.1 SAM-dependent methyltransferase [Streptomyces sp. CMB-StM0423]